MTRCADRWCSGVATLRSEGKGKRQLITTADFLTCELTVLEDCCFDLEGRHTHLKSCRAAASSNRQVGSS